MRYQEYLTFNEHWLLKRSKNARALNGEAKKVDVKIVNHK